LESKDEEEEGAFQNLFLTLSIDFDVAVETEDRRPPLLSIINSSLISLPHASFALALYYKTLVQETRSMISSRGLRSPPRAAAPARNPAMRAKAAAPAARRSSLACSAAAAAVPSVGRPDAQVVTVLGTQWGDEGKGKLVDILARDFDVVARAQVR
jgi:hypothetical protein